MKSLCLVATLGALSVASAFSPTMVMQLRSSGAARAEITSSNRVGTQVWTPRMMPEQPKPDQSPAKPSIPMPMVSVGEGQMDIYSRLAKDRILLLGTDVNDEVANNIVAQMLFLANEDPGKDITLYINSPGGSVSAGMAIYDTMQYIPCDVSTVCFGTAASVSITLAMLLLLLAMTSTLYTVYVHIEQRFVRFMSVALHMFAFF